MIRSLAYVGFTSPAADAWRTFGPDVLGAQLAEDGPDGAVRLRIDDHEARLVLHPGECDDVAYLGWDVGDLDGLRHVSERLADAGIAVGVDPALAERRHVEHLAAFTDPFGFRHQLVVGLAEAGPFTPGRPLRGGFVTGDRGLGHVVLIVPDLDAGLRFFTDVLGFRLSDRIEMGLSLCFLHCNRRHHTLALASIPGMAGLHHVMLELERMDDVGTALDLVEAHGIPLAMSLGGHPNDEMTSFYVRTPSGFDIEYGTGGLTIDDEATWSVETYDRMSTWGHRAPAGGPLLPVILHPVEVPSP